MYNILFTSAGRRVELIQQFINARNNKNIVGNILCADLSELAPTLYFTDKAINLPPLSSPQYIFDLLDVCIKENVDLIIPTIDTELEILLENVGLFKEHNIELLISNEKTIRVSQDKMKTFEFFKSLDLYTPKSFIAGMEFTGTVPCFIKPLSGSSSINAFKVQNHKELEFFKYYINDYIIQDLIEGEEFTIDVFCDFEGKPIYITSRLRIATRSGEVLKTKIISDPILTNQVLRIVDELKPKGPLTIQAIKNRNDGNYYFIEINARFGGGCPLSMIAGADSASALYDLLEGKNLNYIEGAAQVDLVFLRFDQNIVIKQGDNDHYAIP
jgi:carbamoyl-phosphate synthase large subunit